jgi:uncharacterized membrane protein YsdA (DUF1294 family)/cold shock CspA family protein
MRYQGRLSDWNDDKGFGFVMPNGGGDRAFVHIKAFARATRRPIVGDIITYTVTRDTRGRLQASAIRFVGETMPLDDRATPGWFGPLFTLLFVAALAGAAFTGRLTMTVLASYAAMSVFAFIAYGFDKAAATSGRQRTPEATLHGLGLLCGWPGALLAQRVFRHKSRKRAFQSTFWGTVIINIIILMPLVSDIPSGILRAAIGDY